MTNENPNGFSQTELLQQQRVITDAAIANNNRLRVENHALKLAAGRSVAREAEMLAALASCIEILRQSTDMLRSFKDQNFSNMKETARRNEVWIGRFRAVIARAEAKS